MGYAKQLITAGVKNLKEFGYPNVDSNNILTDPVYSAFFRRMLEENTGHSIALDTAITGVLSMLYKGK